MIHVMFGDDVVRINITETRLRMFYVLFITVWFGQLLFLVQNPVVPTIQMIDRLIQQYGPVYCVSE